MSADRLHRNESTPEGRRAWAAVDQAADKAPSRQRERRKGERRNPPVQRFLGADRRREARAPGLSAWLQCGPYSELKRCPWCGELALEGEVECSQCRHAPADDMTWREERARMVEENARKLAAPDTPPHAQPNERAGSSEMEEEPVAWRLESRTGEDDWYTFDLTEDVERARRFGKYSNCRVVPLYTRPSRPAACEITESEAIVCLCERYAAITLKDWHGGVTVWSPTPPKPAAPREEPSEEEGP